MKKLLIPNDAGLEAVTEFIEQSKKSGTFQPEYFDQLFDVMLSQTQLPNEISAAIVSYLKDVKHKEFPSRIMQAISRTQNSSQRAVLINLCWENGSDFSGYLGFFAGVLLVGSWEEAIEAFSVIESMLMDKVDEKEKEQVLNVILENFKKIEGPRREFVLQLVDLLEINQQQ
jgi:hypothetical protein